MSLKTTHTSYFISYTSFRPLKMEKKLYLVDGSSYLHRAYHALPSLQTKLGEQTGAVYGVINMLRRLAKEYHPEYAAVVFDAKGKTFRHQLYPDYKATRPPLSMDLAAQIPVIYELIQALGFKLVSVPGVEADDVLGTFAARAQAAGWRVFIFTGDKDLAQLVNSSVTLFDTLQETRLDEAGVREKFGVPPRLMVDYLALIGDAVDNVPGVAKVGPKTAVKWLQEYGSLDSVMACADKIEGKIGENLRYALPVLPLTRQLLTIQCDLPLPCPLEELRCQPPDMLTLSALYTRLEFRSWLPIQKPEDRQKTECYQTILTQADFDHWLRRLQEVESFAFDTETTSLDYLDARLVGLSVAIQPGEAAYIPLAHDYLNAPRQLDRKMVLNALKPLLEDPQKRKIGQNLKYDAHVLKNHGIELRGISYDTMLESYDLDSAGRHDLDSLALSYLQLNPIRFEDIAGKGAKQLAFNHIPIEQAAPYAAEDADLALRLHHCLQAKLQAEPRLQQVFDSLEMPLVPVLFAMERQGVKIDAGLLRQHSQELQQRLHALEEQACELAGQTFNLASPKQLQEILFNKLHLPVLAKTPGGQPSTAESVLQELAQDFALPRVIMEHRSLSKLKTTYTDKLPAQIRPQTGRVHTSYHQAATQTGRLSSSDPNLQNIPVRTEEGRRIRQAFIAPPGYKLLSADYSQIELRLMAHLSQDEKLVQALLNNEDVHRATAAEVFGVLPAQVSKEQRRAAKAINFGLIYGMSAFGLAKQLSISRTEAQEYINRYFSRYPGVKIFMENTRAQAAQHLYVETIFGRRLYIPEINTRNAPRRQAAERAAINAPLQGSAADIIKLAMIRLYPWLEENQPAVKLILQVHDELVFEVADAVVDTARVHIADVLSNVVSLLVPLSVETGIGNNWAEAHQ